MDPKYGRTQSGQSRPTLSPAPRRFRIEKLEERIAPRCPRVNPLTQWVGGGRPGHGEC